ncbi:hypothetical protein GGI12_002501 [Dipsacomyces acuminosporus]|nr:hypothetical protein GGI12_002501 [Dipsacomyces acuminosporus]
MASTLSAETLDRFKQDGCVVLPDFLSASEVESLRGRIKELLEDFDPSNHPMTTFSTGLKKKHIGDQYFFDSADKISYFLEEDAIKDGKLAVDRHRAINKIGHGLHIKDELFSRLSSGDKEATPSARALSDEEVQARCKPIEVKAGSLVLIHGQVLHRSSHNYSEKSRWIYTFHIVEGGYEYDSRNWLQMPGGAELTKM